MALFIGRGLLFNLICVFYTTRLVGVLEFMAKILGEMCGILSLWPQKIT